MDEPTPVKLCECGCGQPTRIAKDNNSRYGYVKGQPVRFRKGHSGRGKIVSAETRAKIGAAQRGERAANWMGDAAGYWAVHSYLRRHHPKVGICEECGQPAKRTDYALIHGRTYSHNREDYRELCRRCHLRYDLGGKKRSPEARARMSAGVRRYMERERQTGIKRKKAKGADLPQTKLTEKAVIEIRQRRRRGATLSSLGREFGVDPATIRAAVIGTTWAHVEMPHIEDV